MITFTTQSHSEYQLDLENSQVKRVIGLKAPTKRQGAEDTWKKFHSVSEVIVGKSCIFVWETVLEGGELVFKTTCTSPISQILNEETGLN